MEHSSFSLGFALIYFFIAVREDMRFQDGRLEIPKLGLVSGEDLLIESRHG